MAGQGWRLKPPDKSPGTALGAKHLSQTGSFQNAYPFWTVVPRNMSIDVTNICMHNYNVQVSFFKPFNPHIQSVFLFCHWKLWFACVTLGLFIEKNLLFFVLFFSSGSNLHLILYKCVILCLFFFSLLRLSRGSVNAQEQTSSTRLELQLLLFTLIRMEIRLTEAHRKLRLIITMKLVSCRSHSHYCCISFSINIGRQFTVFTSDFII